jgi:uncharacterized protein (DUF697 family)
MQSTLYIVGVDKSISEYAEKLATLIEAQGINTTSLSLDDYKKVASLSDILFDGEILIFVGADTSGRSAVPNISSWQYEKYGCRIGWTGNKCVIFASDTNLAFSDYKKFMDYCKAMQLEYPDVVVPPGNLVAEGVEFFKKLLADKTNPVAVRRAQYGTLVYEFVNNFLASFVNGYSDREDDADNAEAPKRIQQDILRDLKANALAQLTKKQALMCHAIIHTVSVACAAIAFIPIPGADTIPITGAQVSMALGLGKVFNNKRTKADAQILLKTVAAPLFGRVLVKGALVFVPGLGWAINGAIAGTITEILGWTIAKDFAEKSK